MLNQSLKEKLDEVFDATSQEGDFFTFPVGRLISFNHTFEVKTYYTRNETRSLTVSVFYDVMPKSNDNTIQKEMDLFSRKVKDLGNLDDAFGSNSVI